MSPSEATLVETREQLLEQLNATVRRLLRAYQTMARPETVIDDGWTAREVLGHITFWHESFARNVKDLAEGRAPVPLKGKYVELNQQSVEAIHGLNTTQILTRLKAAHRLIRHHILSPTLTRIPYRKGSRDYTPEEHLKIVTDHIAGHLRGIEIALPTAVSRSIDDPPLRLRGKKRRSAQGAATIKQLEKRSRQKAPRRKRQRGQS